MDSELCAKRCFLISGRQDIIKVFLQLKTMFRLNFIKPGFFEGFERSANLILLDISSICRFSDFDFARKLCSLKKKSLFLLPPEIPFLKRKLIYESRATYIEFPVDINSLIQKLEKLLLQNVFKY